MKVQTLIAAAVLAIESTSAHPTSHSHLHKFRLRDVLSKRTQYDTSRVDWNTALKDVDWDSVFGKGKKAAAPAGGASTGTPSSGSGSSPSSQGPSPSASSSSSSDSSGASSSTGNCLDVSKLSKRATTQQDSFLGNYANNIHGESNCKSSKDYSLTFVNKRGSKKTYWLWNKAGDGKNGPNGMMLPASYIFSLEDGQSATFSLDAGSLIGFSEDCGRAANFGGVPNCNVGEASFADGNTGGGSDGGSFYDVSLVPYTDISSKGGNPSKIPLTISAPGRDSSSLTQCNYVEATQNEPGNFPPGKTGCQIGNRDRSALHVTATFG